MEKYDITKPIEIPVGMHKLNNDPGISFQLNRLVNMDGCDLSVARDRDRANVSGTMGLRLSSNGRSRSWRSHIISTCTMLSW